MIIFPNCKINLGLRIIRKRNDGYHDLETVFYPVNFLHDVLEVIPSKETQVHFTMSGLQVEGNNTENLCIKAYELVKKNFPELPAVRIHLHKSIPTGAGLGGGSADAAFMLKLLDRVFKPGFTKEHLTDWSLQLGSDCPFFLVNKPCFASGRGENLTPVNIDLSDWQIILVKPDIFIHTGRAFNGISPAVPAKSVQEIIQQPVQTWKDELINDFETSVFRQYPAIAEIKTELYKQGAIYASLSGSGSTVYGIFPKQTAVTLSFPDSYFIKRSDSQL